MIEDSLIEEVKSMLVVSIQYNLLASVESIMKECERKSRENACGFNVFEIVRINHHEVRMSFFLWELLKQDGRHGMGTVYLKRFFEDVLGFRTDDDELRNAKVYCQKKEYTSDGREKHIDIVIETPYRYIPIEIKIYAKEGNNQCYDYFFIGKEKNLNSKREWGLFFLTLSGGEPESTKDREDCKGFVHAVSWKEEITLWLENIIRVTGSNRINVIEVIRQYLSAIRKLTRQNEEGLQVELCKLIDSSDKMKAAVAISKGLQEVRNELVKKLFTEIDSKFEKEYEKIDCVYSGKYPSLAYKTGEIIFLDKTYVLALRFELNCDNDDGTCYVGFTVSKKTEQGFEGIKINDDLRKRMSSLICSEKLESMLPTLWWIGLLHVPGFGKNKDTEEPDFKNYNKAYYDLYDDDKRREFVYKVTEALSELASWVKV
ncbi:MAG: PD-(D/E)XK nuclease family protein [Synergistaceae bacterium]|nr:PD-(D/E)XK nuclease family protein [Synergistaceae bacterium]MBR0251378.1 PD-(D/E)XK nuclease family protein [Synergistaceae bacterium]